MLCLVRISSDFNIGFPSFVFNELSNENFIFNSILARLIVWGSDFLGFSHRVFKFYFQRISI